MIAPGHCTEVHCVLQVPRAGLAMARTPWFCATVILALCSHARHYRHGTTSAVHASRILRVDRCLPNVLWSDSYDSYLSLFN